MSLVEGARGLLLGPEGSRGQAGGPLERWAAAWVAASKGDFNHAATPPSAWYVHRSTMASSGSVPAERRRRRRLGGADDASDASSLVRSCASVGSGVGSSCSRYCGRCLLRRSGRRGGESCMRGTSGARRGGAANASVVSSWRNPFATMVVLVSPLSTTGRAVLVQVQSQGGALCTMVGGEPRVNPRSWHHRDVAPPPQPREPRPCTPHQPVRRCDLQARALSRALHLGDDPG